MKKLVVLSLATVSAGAVFAGLYGDTPDARHAWAVHDHNRPNPVKVTPAAQPGLPPSDAHVLFDGTRASFEKNWCDSKGNPSQWKFDEAGFFYCAPGWKNGGSVCTREKFGDCQLHLEYRHDPDHIFADKGAQMRGNSGVFLMGNYEIQVLESFYTDPADMKVPNYADGQAGAIYAENPPAVNPARKPGEWQVYDIVFHQPVWEGDKLLHPGSVTLFFNGVLVQDHWEMEGLTTHCRRRPLAPHAKTGALSFQDHGCVVQFRNIWYRPLPSRWDNTTHSVLSAKEGDVMVARYKTASRLFAKIDRSKTDAATLCALLEVVSYSKDAEFFTALKACGNAYMKRVAAMDAAALANARGELGGVKNALGVLQRNKVLSADCPLCAFVNDIWEKQGWNKKK